MTPPQVFAIILTWNSGDDAIETLRRLAASDYPALQVVVVDNASTDATPARLAREFPPVVLLQNDKNLGFAQGNNVGMRYALDHDADYLFLLNDDAFVEPDTLSTLVATAERDPRVAFVGPALVSYHDPSRVYHGARFDFKRLFPEEQLATVPRAGEFESPYIAGCAMLVRAAVAREIGLFDPAYFAYWEDTDWCTRAWRAGYRVVVQPAARVHHKGTLDQTPQKAAFASYLYRRNQFQFARKFSKFPGWVRFARYYSYDTFREIQATILDSQPRAKTEAILDGWWAGLTGHSADDFARAPAWLRDFVIRHAEALLAWLYPLEPLRARFPVRTTLRRLWHRIALAKF